MLGSIRDMELHLSFFMNSSRVSRVECLDEALQATNFMHWQGTPLPRNLVYCFVRGCSEKKDLPAGRQVHSLMISSGLDTPTILGDHLIRLFASCRSLLDAVVLFCTISNPSIFSWHAIISAHSMVGERGKALDLYYQMQEDGVQPDKVTFLCLLRACCVPGAIGQGMIIHDQIVRSGLGSDVVVGNTLMDMYAKCGSLTMAGAVFDCLPHRDVVSWTILIKGYAQEGSNLPALELYEKMRQEGIKPDKFTCAVILKVCSNLRAVDQGKLVHDKFISSGLELDVTIGNMLVDMYAKCGSLKEACKVFDAMSHRNVVSWSVMIAGYAQHGQGFPALKLFQKMLQERLKPDTVTFLCTLKACVSVRAIEHGNWLHEQIIQNGLESDLVLGNTLIDMYVKCGNLEDAHKSFNNLQSQDLVSWNAIITGYAQNGPGTAAVELFDIMRQMGIKPDKVTFVSILKTCGSIGAIEQGQLVHYQILTVGLELDMDVGNALVDMYARLGSLEEAQRAFNGLPNPDTESWGAIIAGSAQHGNCRLAVQYLEMMQHQGLKPLDGTFTSVLTSCSHRGLVQEGCWFFKSMREDHRIAPNVEHFNCMIDLLGRAGCLHEAKELLQTMPTSPDATGWMSLLSTCRAYSNKELGRKCFDELVQLDPTVAAGYVLMSSMYAESHMGEHIQNIEEMRKCASAWKKPGNAWIDMNTEMLKFVVDGVNSSQVDNIRVQFKRIRRFMDKAGYVPGVESILEPLADGDARLSSGIIETSYENIGSKWHSACKFISNK